MIHYQRYPTEEQAAAGVRLVHNFCPGPPDDPGRARPYSEWGFRYWITDEPARSRPPKFITDVLDAGGEEHRCHCGWRDGQEHYGTVGYADEHGVVWWRDKRRARHSGRRA
jgi:hypothetical protein